MTWLAHSHSPAITCTSTVHIAYGMVLCVDSFSMSCIFSHGLIFGVWSANASVGEYRVCVCVCVCVQYLHYTYMYIYL